jgi:integrase
MQSQLKEPKLCEDRGRFFVWLNGKRHYLSAKGRKDAEVKRKQFLANLWLGNDPAPSGTGRSNPPVQKCGGSPPHGVEIDGMLVAELGDEFLEYHTLRLSKTELQNYKYAVGYLVELFGSLPVNEITPKKLRSVRDQMVQSGRLCRKTINNFVAKLIRIFGWGCEEEWVEANVAGALKMVKHLPQGELGTFDHKEREPVPDDVIRRTLPFMPPTLRAMVQLQRILGFRPNEIFKMRVGDIDTTRGNGLWYYVPGSYKTARFVGKIIFPLGKPEQRLIAPYLVGKKPDQPIFSSRTAMEERNAERRANRKSKITPSQAARDKERAAKPSPYSESYNRDSYRQAINYAIKKGNRQLPDGEKIPHWFPYLLRNSAATAIELEHGLDDAQAQLGHTKADMTKRYSKAQLKQREKLAHSRVNPFEKPEE